VRCLDRRMGGPGLWCRRRGGAAGVVLAEGGVLGGCNRLGSRRRAGGSGEWREAVAAVVADMLAARVCTVDTALEVAGRRWKDMLAEVGRSGLKRGDSPPVGAIDSPRSNVRRSRRKAAQNNLGEVPEQQPTNGCSTLAGWVRMPASEVGHEMVVAEGIGAVEAALEVAA